MIIMMSIGSVVAYVIGHEFVYVRINAALIALP